MNVILFMNTSDKSRNIIPFWQPLHGLHDLSLTNPADTLKRAPRPSNSTPATTFCFLVMTDFLHARIGAKDLFKKREYTFTGFSLA